MRFHRLTLVASAFLTVAMFLVALLFEYSNSVAFQNQNNFYLTLFGCTLLIFVLNYVILDFLFNVYGKRQVKEISTILPESISPDADNGMNLRELGERVSEFSQKNATEMGTMKEMETYRKEYIGNVSHELKTPLFSIQGYVETLMDGGVENLGQEQLERAQRQGRGLPLLEHDQNQLAQSGNLDQGDVLGGAGHGRRGERRRFGDGLRAGTSRAAFPGHNRRVIREGGRSGFFGCGGGVGLHKV